MPYILDSFYNLLYCYNILEGLEDGEFFNRIYSKMEGASNNAGQSSNNNSSEEYNPSTLTRAYAERDKLDDEYHDCLQKCKDLCEILDKHNTGENPLDQDQCDNLKNDIKDAHQKTQQKLQERDIVSARIESGELPETDNDEETDSDE